MNTIKKTTFAVFVLGAGLALAPALQAQGTGGSATQNAPGSMGNHGMMGGMGGMSGGAMGGGDMASMMQMMENCNRMMQSMRDQTKPDPSRETPPATPGQRG